MLFKRCTKLTFGLSDILVITFIAQIWVNSVVSLFFRDGIFRFRKNMPQVLNRFLSNFNVVAIKKISWWFLQHPESVRSNCKTSRWFPLIRSVTCCNWFLQLRRNVLVQPFTFRTSETYFLSSAFESNEDGGQSALLRTVLATEFLRQIGGWESKARYPSVRVGLW